MSRPVGRKWVLDAGEYHDLLAPKTSSLDIWETEYLQRLEGDDPVLEWVRATSLRPILSGLCGAERDRFVEVYRERLRMAYPRHAATSAHVDVGRHRRRCFARVAAMGDARGSRSNHSGSRTGGAAPYTLASRPGVGTADAESPAATNRGASRRRACRPSATGAGRVVHSSLEHRSALRPVRGPLRCSVRISVLLLLSNMVYIFSCLYTFNE